MKTPPLVGTLEAKGVQSRGMTLHRILYYVCASNIALMIGFQGSSDSIGTENRLYYKISGSKITF